ncbi:hypothetical protein [Curtobacterium ammoniigenes]|uniref:hypothetical protein n=1 Tax=Curtobacterium ammoniigenes TaxID=395387 RepID=UPI0008326D06|nr:hypothetical protein [Curtobacterium ammoniigenes]
MEHRRSHPVTVLVPLGMSQPHVTAWSATEPSASVSATFPGSDGNATLTISTIVRTGEQFSAQGAVHAIATDPETLAASAVVALLLAAVPPVASDDVRAAARAAVTEIEARARAASATLHDPNRWPPARVQVDGEEFTLRRHTLPEGVAGFADLGTEVITVATPLLPDPLILTRRTADGPNLV